MRVYLEADILKLRERMVGAGFRFKDNQTFTTAQVAEQLGVAQSTLWRLERIDRILRWRGLQTGNATQICRNHGASVNV